MKQFLRIYMNMNMFTLSDADPGGGGGGVVTRGYTGFGTLAPPKKLRSILIQ